jgi:hypothetical protein
MEGLWPLLDINTSCLPNDSLHRRPKAVRWKQQFDASSPLEEMLGHRHSTMFGPQQQRSRDRRPERLGSRRVDDELCEALDAASDTVGSHAFLGCLAPSPPSQDLLRPPPHALEPIAQT